MLKIEDIKKNRLLLNAIDWDMTNEEAVRLYLEWGNNWAGGNYVIRSKDDVAHYFVINTWEKSPAIFLIRRNSEETQELAKIELPPDLEVQFLKSIGNNKGIYALEGKIKSWLKEQLGA